MDATRRIIAVVLIVAAASVAATGMAVAARDEARASETLRTWYRLVLELVRHTPTYSPPVASRAFAYLGVAAFESVASGSNELRSLAGQLNGLEPLPLPRTHKKLDDAVVLQAALATAAGELFSNTGPTGQRAMAALGKRLGERTAEGLEPDLVAASEAYGRAVALHVLAWSRDDGGAAVENMGFPTSYAVPVDPARWVPTSLIAQQQAPLLPKWGANRTFAMPDGAACPLPPPPAYSEDPSSLFHAEALEVYETVRALTSEQRAIARFWSDDPMLSPTPPGHWIAIAMQVLERDWRNLAASVDVLARLGVGLADSFVACWHAKFEFDLLRPVTYIRRLIDPAWEPPLITPPFPEYPSGHSTQSGAAATVLTAFFGDNFAFEDATHVDEGLPVRTFPSFWAAAEEAGMSRLYGGIHFRAAIERGLDQGRCVGRFATTLQTRR